VLTRSPNDEGQGVVTGIQEVIVPELTSDILYTMLSDPVVVDILSQLFSRSKV
jgi:hypothetical protein